MDKKVLPDRCRGALIGGAVGDALGYAVEFSSLSSIRQRYGAAGITDYDPDDAGIAEFSDDTQMSLFTAEGILDAVDNGRMADGDIVASITQAYVRWYRTQLLRPIAKAGDGLIRPVATDGEGLIRVGELWSRRAPGTTCMSALDAISVGRRVVNHSKGCGGVMRVAPIGIFAAAHPDILDSERAGRLAGYAAEVTHKHPLSTYASMALAMIVAECLTEDAVDRDTFRAIVCDRVLGAIATRHDGDADMAALRALIEKALELAVSEHTDTDAIFILGEGWVAEETLAIAVFSVMRYIGDFGRCVCCAVNHIGDSDSTGAVAGNIIGAIVGYDAIPARYKAGLELRDLLLTVADDLAQGRRTRPWRPTR